MTISQILLSAKKKLKNISESPDLDAEILLFEVLEVSREFLFSRPDFRLSPRQIHQFGVFLQKRILGFSIAVILQKKDFFGREFFVNENVLVPRPETELLLKKTMEIVGQKKSGKIIDIGTGSGILAISLFLELEGKFEISAVDISEKALEVAKKNAEKFNANIKCVHSDFSDFLENYHENPSDFLGKLPIQKTFFSPRPLFLVANLPYVPENERHFSTKKEPSLAIFSGKDGLDAFCLFFEKLQNIDFEGVFFEFHPPQKVFFERFLSQKFPHYSAEFFRDFSGEWRIGRLTKIIPKT